MHILQTSRRIAGMTIVAIAAFGFVRAAGLGAGGGGLAATIAMAAAMLCFAAGCRIARPAPGWVRLAAPIFTIAIYLCIPVVAGAWMPLTAASREIIILQIFGLSLLLCIIPFGALGWVCRETPVRYLGDACFAAAAAICYIDGPFGSDAVVAFAPAALLLFQKRADAPENHNSAPGADAPAGLPGIIATFAMGAAIATSVLCVRLQMRDIVRGDQWGISQIDATGLLVAGLGAWIVGGYIQKTGAVRAPLGAAIGAAGIAAAILRITTLFYRPVFDTFTSGLVQKFGVGVAVDGPFFSIILAAGAIPLFYLSAGAAARGATCFGAAHASRLAGGAGFALLVAAAGMNATFGDNAGDNFQPGHDGVARISLILMIVSAVAAAIPAWRRPVAGIAAVAAIATGVFVIIKIPRAIPESLINQTRVLVAEKQHAISRVETVAGAISVIEAPELLETRPRRSTRTWIGRVPVSPGIHAAPTRAAAITASIAARPGAQRVLVTGAKSEADEKLFYSAGARELHFAAPWNPSDARVAASSGDDLYDLIFVPPQPADLADTSFLYQWQRLATLNARLRTGGVLAVFTDLSTTPAPVLRELFTSGIAARFVNSIVFVSDGVREPAAGLMIKKQDAGPWAAGFIPEVTVSAAYFRISGHDYYDSRPRAARREGAQLLAELLKDRAPEAALARAIAEFEKTDWTLSPFRTPIELQPVTKAACDEIVKSAAAGGAAFAPARQAFLQLSSILKLSSLQQLLEFSREMLKADPTFDAARLSLAFAHRGLLDPQGALQILLDESAPADFRKSGAFLVEQANCELALGNAAKSIEILKGALTAQPTNPEIVRALVEVHLSQKRASEAVTYATHLITLTPGDPDSKALLERARRAADAAAPPPLGPSQK